MVGASFEGAIGASTVFDGRNGLSVATAVTNSAARAVAKTAAAMKSSTDEEKEAGEKP
jgi:hypothetical protein